MKGNCHLDKRRRIQCKDVSTRELLSFIQDHPATTFYDLPVENSIWNVVPSSIVPRCVLSAKLYRLVKNGYITGCACGCRGDFTITPNGIHRLRALTLHRQLSIEDLVTCSSACFEAILKETFPLAIEKGMTSSIDAMLHIMFERGQRRLLLRTILQSYHLRRYLKNWRPLLNALRYGHPKYKHQIREASKG
jgi:hypothetical protein